MSRTSNLHLGLGAIAALLLALAGMTPAGACPGDFLVTTTSDAGTGSLAVSYEEQIRWEWACLERADAIVFWVPRELTTLPGFITNIEFGLHCRSGKVLLGYPPGAPKMRYLHLLAGAWNIPVFHDLSDLLRSAVARLCEAGGMDFRERLP